MLEREKAALRFAHRIAGMLDLEVKEHSCEGLVIIALPGFLCAIRAALSTDVSARVLLEVPRDLAKQRVLTIENQIRSAAAGGSAVSPEAVRRMLSRFRPGMVARNV